MGKTLDFMARKMRENTAKTLLDKVLARFGHAPDAVQNGEYVFIPVPRESIEQSEKAVKWLDDFITALEEDSGDTDIEDEIIEALKGTYFVFRDCSLLAKHYLKFRDVQEPKYKKNDIMLRFNENPKNKNEIQLVIGFAEKGKVQ